MITGDEASAARGATSSPVSRTQTLLPRLIAWTAVVFVLAMVMARWDRVTGFTSLLRFGENHRETRIPAVQRLPLATKPNLGYDGQFYAQIAVSGQPTDPELSEALDGPAYRLRRVLLPALAHVLGGGDAWRALHVYAALNVIAWLATAWLLWRIIGPNDLRATAVWLGCMLGLGTLDSVRMALTDLPAVLLVLIAVGLAQHRRMLGATGLLAVAGLTRETSVLAVGALDARPLSSPESWRDHLVRGAIVAAPVLVWASWLYGRVSSANPLGRANLDWPGVVMTEYGLTWARAVLGGDFNSRYIFGLLAIGSFTWQSLAILRQWRSPSPWVRVGVPFALLFWILGDAVWNGYWAVPRACLPLTFAYNLTLPRDSTFAWRWSLGNVCLLHGIWRFLPE